MDKYTLEFSNKDIGELITLIRVDKARLNTESFAREIGVKESVLLQVEEGVGAHAYSTLQKVKNRYHKHIKISLLAEIS